MGNSAILNDINFHVGDTVRVHYKLIEKETVSGKAKKEKKEEIRERTQVFEGIVISIKGNSKENRMFTVRRIGSGSIGIERIFPLSSPWIKKIEIKKLGSVRRAKLYYLRDKQGKEQEKLKEKKTKVEAVSSKEIKTKKSEVPKEENKDKKTSKNDTKK
jgi:large subunit ribosomal protein L19